MRMPELRGIARGELRRPALADMHKPRVQSARLCHPLLFMAFDHNRIRKEESMEGTPRMKTRGWPDGDIDREIQAANEIAILCARARNQPAPIFSTPSKKTNLKFCDICDSAGRVSSNGHSKHHIVPRSEHKRLIAQGFSTGLHRKIWLCRRCHNSVHEMFSNSELAACSWDETRLLMKERQQ